MGTIVGNRIHELRRERGITQPQLADAIGVSNGAISLWENGVNEPKASYIVAICKFFGVTSDYLLGIEDSDFIGSKS